MLVTVPLYVLPNLKHFCHGAAGEIFFIHNIFYAFTGEIFLNWDPSGDPGEGSGIPHPKVGPQKWDPMCHKLRPHLGSWRPGSAHYDV